MLGELINDTDDDGWGVLLQFHKVVETICAPEMHRGHIALLEEEIQELYRMRQATFPEQLFKPKDHYLLHYPEQCRRFGPLVNVWSFRFEAKHNYFLEVFKPCKNHMNIAATLAKRHQYLQCVFGQEPELFFVETTMVSPKKMAVTKLNADLYAVLNLVEDLTDVDFVTIGNSIKVGSTTYGPDMAVVIGMDGALYEFSAVQQVVATSNKQYLVCKEVETLGHDHRFNAYRINITSHLQLVDIDRLKYKAPLGIYTMPGGGMGVVIKYKMLF